VCVDKIRKDDFLLLLSSLPTDNIFPTHHSPLAQDPDQLVKGRRPGVHKGPEHMHGRGKWKWGRWGSHAVDLSAAPRGRVWRHGGPELEPMTRGDWSNLISPSSSTSRLEATTGRLTSTTMAHARDERCGGAREAEEDGRRGELGGDDVGGGGDGGGQPWRVDVPLRFRGRMTHGVADVMLEVLRVDVGRELPDGAPHRGSTWGWEENWHSPGSSTGTGTGSGARKGRRRRTGGGRLRGTVDALIDTGETAVVLACLGAVNPDGVGAKISSALAFTGAVCVAADFACAALGIGGEECGGGCAGIRGGGGGEDWKDNDGVGFSLPGGASARALASRFCSGSLALHASGVALRLVNPELHRTLQSAAALAVVKVAFAQPERGGDGGGRSGAGNRGWMARLPRWQSRGGESGGQGGGGAAAVDTGVWHRRYRWAAIRIMGLVPRTPTDPVLKPLIALFSGAAVVLTGAGENNLKGGFGSGGGFGGGTVGEGGGGSEAVGGRGVGRRRGPCYRLHVDWAAKKGRGERRWRWRGNPWKVRSDGEDLSIALVDLDQVTTRDILQLPLPEPASASTSGRSTPRRGPAAAEALAPSPPGFKANQGARSEGEAGPATAPAGLGLSTSATSATSSIPEEANTHNGDIWRDARYVGGTGPADASTIALMCRAAYLAAAFIPVFAISIPLLMLSEWVAVMRFVGYWGGYASADAAFVTPLPAVTGSEGEEGEGDEAAAGGAGFTPAAVACRAALRRRAWSYLHFSVSMCGAALVKWAQWASVRRDIFPEDFCTAMSALHDDAPRHSKRQTERILSEELGVSPSRIFAHFPDEPVASGSIAQVYRCTLRPEVATACAARDPELARRLRAHHKLWEQGQRAMLGQQGHGQQSASRPGASAGAEVGRTAAACGSVGFWLGFGRRLRRSRGGGVAEGGGGGGENTETLAAAAAAALGSPAGCVVAVKVRHPGVERQIFLDFQILKRAARLVSGVPALKGLNLEETLGQFSHTMTAQTDLRTEARNLRRFGRNFRRARAVSAPWPVAGLVTAGLLCETFERGEALSSAIRRGCEHNATLCAHGVDTYLKMLLRDNFLHSDLHPGNILFHMHQPPGLGPRSPAPPSASGASAALGASLAGEVRLVLLDFGIADELPADVRNRFLTFLFCLVHTDGVAAADAILGWSSDQKCTGAGVEALRRDMCQLCETMCVMRTQKVDLDAVLKAVMVLLRRHGVSIDAIYASLVISLCVLVGFASALDENLNLFEVAVTAFLSYSVTGDVVGKLFEK